MDREVGDEGLAGGVVWRSGEPRRPTGQRVGGLSTTSGPHPSQSQVEEPVGRLPLEPSPGPHMRRWWQIFVLCVFWMLLLWLVTPCLDLKTDSAPQEKWMDMAPRRCSCPWFKFRQCGCPSGSLNHSVCHHTAGEHRFDAGYEKMRGSLMGGAESTRPGAVLWWSDLNAASELGRVWKKLLEVIPQLLMSYFDIFCGTCALMGNSKILRAASISNNVNQLSMVSRMNQAPVQGFEADVGRRTTVCVTYPEIDSPQDPGAQLLLLPLNSSGLKFRIVQVTRGSNEKEDKVSLFGFGTDQLMRWSHYWDDKYWFKTNTHSFKEEQQVILKLQCEGKVAVYN
ncbi:uncharacterized protein C20orf173 homolog [Bos javanicus]|uniref:uncharacterized protein C20orf173 homolog n=1 Tax=Bos javanicus TaxID=9906 RepID=UPI002AA61B43|nr:uncharacterized protein C20orf173 homolog [Bos javanicus]